MNKHLHQLIGAALLVLCAAGINTSAQTSEPPREPILRIETGMHTSVINRIGVDRNGEFLVTSSDDKSARVWELQTGRLLRILRPPVDEGDEGKLYAAAMSPDGETIAVGGWTKAGTPSHNVFLFDRASGRLTRRLNGLPNVIDHLAFSRDGRLLAATFGTSGVRVWRTTDWTEAGRDVTCGKNDSYGADFDNAGHLVTSCYDGSLRLYDSAMRLLVTAIAPGGKRPSGVRFSPDGRRIAVGYSDSARIDVVSADTLGLLYSPDVSGVRNGNLSKVAWSIDGTMLYAGGTADSTVVGPIRRWENSGRGAYVDTHVSSSTIFDIAPLPGGGIVYSTAEPTWGVLDAQHRQTRQHQVGEVADYRSNTSGFLTDAHANAVRFSYEMSGVSPAVLNLADRNLRPNAPATSDLHSPRTEAPGLSIDDWIGGVKPTLNKAPLELENYERSHSLAIAPDAQRFLIGTNYWLRLFDRLGKEVWKAPIPSDAWALNISGDGRLAVVAYGDGTIRWHRMMDGKELLAFFPHADRKRWILWTPSGYYDASPGAEELIGWHVNNGRDAAADFFPAGQFRSTFYRPDVVARVLEAGNEARALAIANEEAGRKQQQLTIAQQLPPIVEIVSPSDNAEVSSTDVTMRVNVRTPSGEPVTNIRALVDGRPAIGARQLLREGNSGANELQVTIPERDCEISVIAENRYAPSVPATVRVKWRGAAAVRPGTISIKPKLYILAVGISHYGNPKYNLSYADKDARDFVIAMQAQKDLLYRDVVVYHDKALTDEAATKDEILDGLDWIRKETTSNDVAMVFIAGHGVNDQNNYYYFCPYNIDPERLLRTGVAFSDIKNTVSAIAGKALFFVDTCHSGNSLGLAGRRGTLDINIVINDLASAQNGVVVFSGSTGSESSYERPEWNNGAFSKAVIEGINGAADLLHKGTVTYTMLNVYVTERVKELTKGQQHPTMISPQTVPDFPIAVKR
jgi:WD40 repeat protein